MGVPDFETDPREHFAYLGASEENGDGEFHETDYDLNVGELNIHYVNKHRFHKCPHVTMHIGGQPIIAVVDSGSEATILAQELFKKLAPKNIEMLHILTMSIVSILVWGNRTKKIKTQALVPFEMSSGYFEHIYITAPGMIADCILRVDFLDKFQVTISFKDQCMYTKDENGCRR